MKYYLYISGFILALFIGAGYFKTQNAEAGMAWANTCWKTEDKKLRLFVGGYTLKKLQMYGDFNVKLTVYYSLMNGVIWMPFQTVEGNYDQRDVAELIVENNMKQFSCPRKRAP